MRILAVSDIHGELRSVETAISRLHPHALLSCGDWGDTAEVDAQRLAAIVAQLPAMTTFGNHDPTELLGRLRDINTDPVLLAQGEVRKFGDLRIAAIGGIWAKSHTKPYYVTDEDVAGFAEQVARLRPVDILLTHGCPIGLADLTPAGRHGGQRCFLDAFQKISPRLHLTGHLHVSQERTLKDGRQVINVGSTAEGNVVVIEASSGSIAASRIHLKEVGP